MRCLVAVNRGVVQEHRVGDGAGRVKTRQRARVLELPLYRVVEDVVVTDDRDVRITRATRGGVLLLRGHSRA